MTEQQAAAEQTAAEQEAAAAAAQHPARVVVLDHGSGNKSDRSHVVM